MDLILIILGIVGSASYCNSGLCFRYDLPKLCVTGQEAGCGELLQAPAALGAAQLQRSPGWQAGDISSCR